MSAKYTAAQNRATQKYIKNAYDTISVRVKKGECKIIKDHAKKNGESVNVFVNRAIKETILSDNEKDA